MPLYGHEMDETVTPLETGLGSYVKMNKPDFIGKKALEEKGEPARTRIGLKITGRGIAREHCDVYGNGRKIGATTSGTHCPFLGYAVAMALVESPAPETGTPVEIDVRGRKITARSSRCLFTKNPNNFHLSHLRRMFMEAFQVDAFHILINSGRWLLPEHWKTIIP